MLKWKCKKLTSGTKWSSKSIFSFLEIPKPSYITKRQSKITLLNFFVYKEESPVTSLMTLEFEKYRLDVDMAV